MENYWRGTRIYSKGPVATRKAASQRGAGERSKSNIHAIKVSDTTKNMENILFEETMEGNSLSWLKATLQMQEAQ